MMATCRLFLDGCVLMDFYTARKGADDAETILALAERKVVECVTSSLVICTLTYLFEQYKILPKKDIPPAVDSLMKIVGVLPVGKEELESAVNSAGKDFEDNVEMACAEKGCDYIITDNVKHFLHSSKPVLTPSQFLKAFFA